MKSLWNNKEAKKYKSDLDLRVYTSRLLGQNSSLVLHGGGNTSVKSKATNLFGETEDILYVKGSGWDLATIEDRGFAPVKMDTLLKMAKLNELDDTNMVKYQRMAMIDPSAPNPSVEAILHAIIPFKFIDHTHTDAVVTITNTQDGAKKIKEIYGDKVLVVPYIMPGFVLAKLVYNITRTIDWNNLDGIVLLNHGLFTFNDDAKKSYEKTIELVSKAEDYLRNQGSILNIKKQTSKIKPLNLATIRKEVSTLKGQATISILNDSKEAIYFSKQDSSISQRGPLTPDHVIRTKRVPAILNKNYKKELKNYTKEYKKYFKTNATNETMLNPAPNFAILKNRGSLSFGSSAKEANIIKDINNHTFEAILKAQLLGGYKALSAKDIFDVEYWELEQAKLKKSSAKPQFAGKIAVVTGAASGIGRTVAKELNAQGCAVVALDINKKVTTIFNNTDIIGFKANLTKSKDIKNAVEFTVKKFGGIDIVVSNAGIFTPSQNLENPIQENWQKSMDINLTSHQKLLKETIPYLKLGIDPTIIMIASKNFSAPDKGVAAYSVTKAEQTQLSRVAALELGKYGIRVNTIHPHLVFDTAIWSDEILKNRAKAYNMTVQEYKTNNILKTQIDSTNVADLLCAMAGKPFAKTTGSQIALDGGSDRII